MSEPEATDRDEALVTRGDLLLTFAIPTFNRYDCLRLLVDSILGQIDWINTHAPRVELLLCDNASTDETGPYLDGLAQHKGVTVLRHRANLGADANVIHCFRQARGVHVWICGDDDLPLPGVLEMVVECLARERPALLYLPALWHPGDLSPFLAHRPEPGRFIPVDAMSLALFANAYITFLSSWVVDRDAYLEWVADPDPVRYAGTSLSQLEWHLAGLASNGRLMMTDRKWVIARSGNTGAYSLLEVFITNYTRIIDDKLRGHRGLRQFFRDFMLRSYLPGLVWGMRQRVVGDFGSLDQAGLQAKLRVAWPQERAFAAQVVLIGRLPRPLAYVVFVLSWLTSKLWLSCLGFKLGNRR